MIANQFLTLDAQFAESHMAQVEPQEIGGEDNRPLCYVILYDYGDEDCAFYVYQVFDVARNEVVYAKHANSKSQESYRAAGEWANSNGYRIIYKQAILKAYQKH
jgi:hypothetical protein